LQSSGSISSRSLHPSWKRSWTPDARLGRSSANMWSTSLPILATCVESMNEHRIASPTKQSAVSSVTQDEGLEPTLNYMTREIT